MCARFMPLKSAIPKSYDAFIYFFRIEIKFASNQHLQDITIPLTQQELVNVLLILEDHRN